MESELAHGGCRGEYRLGNWIGKELPGTALPINGESGYEPLAPKARAAGELALPMVCLEGDASQVVIGSDPYFSTRFSAAARGDGVEGECRCRYWSSRVALEDPEKRTFVFWLGPPAAAEPRLRAPVDAFFRLTLPEIPAGPSWTQKVYQVYYDYMHLKGQSWEKDLDEMAKRLGPENTRHVAVCYHGWYDRLGAYCFDEQRGTIADHWECIPVKGQNFPMTKGLMRQHLAHAHQRGFRTLIYFADGLADCPARPGFRPDWLWTALRGKKSGERIACWSPPGVFDGPKCFARNPAHPDVIAWHHAYLAALIREFGDVIDGFVWDETLHMGTGYAAACAATVL